MSEENLAQAGRFATGLADIVGKVNTPLRLAGLAILGVVAVILGTLNIANDNLSSYTLTLIGGGLLAILTIVWLFRRIFPLPVPNLTQPGAASDAVMVPQEGVAEPLTLTQDWEMSCEKYGFFVERSRTEVRFLDWEEGTHREVYEKYLKISPMTSGEIEVDVLSGSSSRDIEFQCTHVSKEMPREDDFHVRSRYTIRDAKKMEPIEIVEKSIRRNVSNVSEETHTEATVHPQLEGLGVVEPCKWYVVLHVLYPTKDLAFKADLAGNKKAKLGTIDVHEFCSASKPIKVEEKPEVIGTEEGALQVLLWRKKWVKAGANFVIHWKWE